MNDQKDQTTVPQQQIIFAEAAPLSTTSPLSMQPELEIRFGDLTPEQQAMVEQFLNQQLAITLAEKKANHGAESVTRFVVRIGEIYVEADFQLDMTEARAQGRPHKKRIQRFLERRRDRLEQYLEGFEERLATRAAIEVGKSVYPQLKANNDKFSLLNIRFFTNEKTVINQAPDQDEYSPAFTGTLFGSSVD